MKVQGYENKRCSSMWLLPVNTLMKNRSIKVLPNLHFMAFRSSTVNLPVWSLAGMRKWRGHTDFLIMNHGKSLASVRLSSFSDAEIVTALKAFLLRVEFPAALFSAMDASITIGLILAPTFTSTKQNTNVNYFLISYFEYLVKWMILMPNMSIFSQMNFFRSSKMCH